MPQIIMVGSDNTLRVVEAGPVGPRGPQGLPGGTTPGTGGARAGDFYANATVETIDEIEYAVVTAGASGDQIYFSDVHGHENVLVRIDAPNDASIAQEFFIMINADRGAKTFTQNDVFGISPINLWGSGDMSGSILSRWSCLPGSLLGSPEDLWLPGPLVTTNPRRNAAFITPLPLDGGGETDGDIDATSTEQNCATITTDAGAFTTLRLKLEDGQGVRPVRFEAFNTDAVTMLQFHEVESGVHNELSGIDLDRIRSGNSIIATVYSVRDAEDTMFLIADPIANPVIPDPPEVGPRKVLPTLVGEQEDTQDTDNFISCLGKSTRVNILSTDTWDFAFSDVAPGEYAEIWLKVYNNSGGVPAITFGGTTIDRVNDIAAGDAREFQVLVWNDEGTVKHSWNQGRTIINTDPDY